MKNSLFSFAISLFLCLFSWACTEEHDSVYFEDLPSEAQAFLQQYFPNNTVSSAERHDEEPRYEVTLDNGYEIDFYGDGRWQEIDSNHSALPSELIKSVLPQTIIDYLNSEYADFEVSAIERSSAGYNIELATTPPITLYFDPTGNVLVHWDE